MKLMSLTNDESLARLIRFESEKLQWTCENVTSFQLAREKIKGLNPDLILIEAMTLQALEKWTELTQGELRPTVFINFDLSEEFVVKGWENGAIGFIPKSVLSGRSLSARLKAFEKLQPVPMKRRVSRLNLLLDSESSSVQVGSEIIDLTHTEFKILRELAGDKDATCSRTAIQKQVFGDEQTANRSLDVHICSLRKKLKPVGLEIDSVRGVGYRLCPLL